MRNITFLILVLCVAYGCKSTNNGTKSPTVTQLTPLDENFYTTFSGNQARLHQLMLGTFVAYDSKEGEALESWTVSETDSVILYSFQIGDITKQGYWVYSYEFMTSLPNNPIYTTIKEIVQKDRDTFEVHYYETPAKYTLLDILEKKVLDDIDFKKLVKTPKMTTFHRVTNTHFRGYSEVYEDKNCQCYRQNSYDASPSMYKVDASFFNLADKSPKEVKNWPNVMLRRLMDQAFLLAIAKKGAVGN